MSTLKVNTILSADTPTVNITDGLNVTGVSTVAALNSTSIVNTTQLSNRNLVINGAMKVAQRGTSSTSTGYKTVDRFKVTNIQTDENTTNSQHTLTSSDTGPYGAGFRKSFHIQNGNQTGGAGTSDRITFNTSLEAQNLANSGWDYTSSSSYVTLQFWVRSSVAQNFNFYLMTSDGTAQIYPMVTGSLSANTWTKITKSIPGNSNLTFNDDNGTGLTIEWSPFMGTAYTSGSRSNDVWAAAGSYDERTPDQTSTWYTTNDATFEITGVQLELGSVATPFEHRSFGDELARCQRYLFKNINESGESGCNYGKAFNTTELFASVRFPVAMRATPTITAYSNSGTAGQVHKLGSPDTAYTSIDRLDNYGGMRFNSSGAWGTGDTDMYSFTFEADAEL